MTKKKLFTAITLLGISFAMPLTGCSSKEKIAETKVETNKADLVVDDKMSPSEALDKTLYKLINGTNKIDGIKGWQINENDNTYQIYITLEPEKEFTKEMLGDIRNNVSENLKIIDDSKSIELNFNDEVTFIYKDSKWDKDVEAITVKKDNNTESKEGEGE